MVMAINGFQQGMKPQAVATTAICKRHSTALYSTWEVRAVPNVPLL